MTWSTERARPRVFAEPLGEHGWRVCRNDADASRRDPTIGYIDELGGTYEVRVLATPTERHYAPTFKEAMAYFGSEGPPAAVAAPKPASAHVSGAGRAAIPPSASAERRGG